MAQTLIIKRKIGVCANGHVCVKKRFCSQWAVIYRISVTKQLNNSILFYLYFFVIYSGDDHSKARNTSCRFQRVCSGIPIINLQLSLFGWGLGDERAIIQNDKIEIPKNTKKHQKGVSIRAREERKPQNPLFCPFWLYIGILQRLRFDFH